MTTVTDLLADRRPHRADARRNFDAILDAARDSFAEFGPGASLEEIARRAGVGSATLHRNFPTREDLIQCVFFTEVETLCAAAGKLAANHEPLEALAGWLREYVSYLGTKHALIDGLNRGSESFRTCLDALKAAGAPLLLAAQQAGLVRDDIDIDDTMRLVNAVTAVTVRDDSQQERLLGVVLDGITTR
jgi:AcrR family transcriptional regulator